MNENSSFLFEKSGVMAVILGGILWRRRHVKELCVVFVSKPLQNLRLGVSKLPKCCSTRYRSCTDVSSHLLKPAEKHKQTSWLKMPLVEACRGKLTQIERYYALRRMHVKVAGKEKNPHYNSLFTVYSRQGMLEKND